MEELVADIKSWLNQLPDRAVIGVSGHGSAGKSTFSAMLMEALGEEETAYLNADPYIIYSRNRKIKEERIKWHLQSENQSSSIQTQALMMQ